jgi:hypothetical protein
LADKELLAKELPAKELSAKERPAKELPAKHLPAKELPAKFLLGRATLLIRKGQSPLKIRMKTSPLSRSIRLIAKRWTPRRSS